MKFRNLTADEVECRIAMCKDSFITLLLYKDARVDMKILDETVGSENWQRKHAVVNGNLFCTVSIWDKGKQQWISKEDVGVESYTEKEKGQSSDSFKRACVNWGIGRELYTAPEIKIWESNNGYKKNAKGSTYDNFEVRLMEVVDGAISKLIIENTTLKKIVFTWEKDEALKGGSRQERQAKKEEPKQKPAEKPKQEELKWKPSEIEIKKLYVAAIDNNKVPTGKRAEEFVSEAILRSTKGAHGDVTRLAKEEYEKLYVWLGGEANAKKQT